MEVGTGLLFEVHAKTPIDCYGDRDGLALFNLSLHSLPGLRHVDYYCLIPYTKGGESRGRIMHLS